jgi:hypothetical protein
MRIAPAILLVALGLIASFSTNPVLGQNRQQIPAPPTSLLDPRLIELSRASRVWEGRQGPERTVVDQVCIVPDVATFLEAIATWDDSHFFPILIEDVELTLKFLDEFRPARVVRFPKRAPSIEGEALWQRALSVVGDRSKHDPKTRQPGVVFASAKSPALPGLVALAAGRFQPLIRLDTTKSFADMLSPEDLKVFLESISEALLKSARDYAKLGDDCDFITLAGDYPYRYSSPRGVMAIDDRIGRNEATMERWAFTGRLMGDARYSVYAAMCSLFLQPKSVTFFNGYPENSAPWNGYRQQPAAEKLRSIIPAQKLFSGPARGGIDGWHTAFDSINKSGLLYINTKGSPRIFDLTTGPAHACDIMPTRPTAICIIHSYSAADPTDATTIAGQWMAQGAFLYHGSMDEPFLNAFRAPELSGDLLAKGIPFSAALRPSMFEEFGGPWKLVLLGDPLYRLVPRSSMQPRSAEFAASKEWFVYSESAPPAGDATASSKLVWALMTALSRLHKAEQTDPKKITDDIREILNTVDRMELSDSMQLVLDSLRLELALRADSIQDLRTALRAIPFEARTAANYRVAISCLVRHFSSAMISKDFTNASLIWSELMRINLDTEFKKQITSRVATLAKTPAQVAEYRTLLRASLSGRLDQATIDIISTELKRYAEFKTSSESRKRP